LGEEVARGGQDPKDVKYEDRSGNVYENKGSNDTLPDNYSSFNAWSAPFLQKWTKIRRAFWLNPHKSDDHWGEAGTKIGLSVHRPIDPSAEQEVVLRWPDEPMVRCSHCLVFPLCISKQKGLVINSENLAKMYIIKNKALSRILVAGRRRTRGEKMKVSSIMLLKTNGGKMSESILSIMLMKRQVVTVAFPLY
jgi:hypothetical protein